MRPLSIVKFIRGSLGKALPLAITAALAVALLYFASIVASHLIADKQAINVSWLSNMSVISGGASMTMLKGNGIAAEDEAALRASGYAGDVLAANLWSADYKTITETASMFILMVGGQDVATALRWQKLTLTEGALPAVPYEIVLHRKLAASLGVKTGSVVSRGTPGWRIGADAKVVGIVDGPAMIGVGFGHEGCLAPGAPDRSLLAFTGDMGIGMMNEFIHKNLGGKYGIYTLGMAEAALGKVTGAFHAVTAFLGLFIVLALGVLLGNISMMQYAQRLKEFEMMNAVGYARGFIARKVCKELGVSNLIGYVAGIGLAVLSGWLINVYVLGDKLQAMPLIQISAVLWTLLIPAAITAFGMIAPLRLLRVQQIM